eukprot:9474043-Pyramimonas_sp.AAC.2
MKFETGDPMFESLCDPIQNLSRCPGRGHPLVHPAPTIEMIVHTRLSVPLSPFSECRSSRRTTASHASFPSKHLGRTPGLRLTRTCCSSKKPSVQTRATSLEDSVRAIFSDEDALMPFVLDGEMLDDDVAFESDLYSATGRNNYLEGAMLWKQLQEEELRELQFEVLRVSEVGYGKALVQWQQSWLPPGIVKIVEWGRAWPGMKLEYYDVLDKYATIYTQ